MTSQVSSIPSTESYQASETAYLRSRILAWFLTAALLLGWAWLGYILMEEMALWPDIAPTVALCLVSGVAFALRAKHYRLACWMLLVGLILAVAALTRQYPMSQASALGVLVFITAHALLTPAEAAIALALLLGAIFGIQHVPAGPLLTAARIKETLLFYILVWGATWLAGWPLATLAACALSGWEQARQALLQVRERRAELYRTLRALEEATRRIEHMNRELIAAQSEAQLARAQKAKFAATVSHELRGPLNMVLGFSRMMALSPEQYGVALPSVYHADVDAIYRNTQHLAALVDDVLDLSQIEAHQLPLVRDRVEINEDVIAKVDKIVRPLVERKGLSLQLDLEQALPWVLADPVRLRQVMLNLLTNAVRETEHGGIIVRTQLAEDAITVSIADTGPGIAPEDMSRLFEEFRQLESSKARHKGSGLGLKISKQFIELHGGQIWVESQQGKGTVFTFTLPLPGTHTFAGTLRHGTIAPPRSLHETVIVVHENPHIVRTLGRYVEGYRLIGSSDSDHLSTLVDELHPQAIITGHNHLDEIRDIIDHLGFDVPVIGCNLPRSSYQLCYDNVIGYLTKPINSEMLIALMKDIEQDGETVVLLVDDDQDAVRLMERMLTSLPRRYRILRAYDGQRAYELLTEQRPDIIFLDLFMPVLDGEGLLRRMSAREQLGGIPVVIVSALDVIEGQMTIEMPLCLQMAEPMGLMRGARCLHALLDAVTPRYLGELEIRSKTLQFESAPACLRQVDEPDFFRARPPSIIPQNSI